MTFNEALKKKNEIESKVKLDKHDFLCVVPQKNQDLLKYLNLIRTQDTVEEDAIRFSSDGMFSVCKVWTDMIEIRYEIID